MWTRLVATRRIGTLEKHHAARSWFPFFPSQPPRLYKYQVLKTAPVTVREYRQYRKYNRLALDLQRSLINHKVHLLS